MVMYDFIITSKSIWVYEACFIKILGEADPWDRALQEMCQLVQGDSHKSTNKITEDLKLKIHVTCFWYWAMKANTQ
jgi:hypothetical protein